jgi:hypothetical protein
VWHIILQRAFPHYICLIVDNPYYKSIMKVPVPQTLFFLSFKGTLRGALVPNYQNVMDEIAAVMHEMALWYYTNRIEANPKRYKKWLLNPQ